MSLPKDKIDAEEIKKIDGGDAELPLERQSFKSAVFFRRPMKLNPIEHWGGHKARQMRLERVWKIQFGPSSLSPQKEILSFSFSGRDQITQEKKEKRKTLSSYPVVRRAGSSAPTSG